MAWTMATYKRAQRDSSLRINRTRSCLQQRLAGVSAAVLKPGPKAEEKALLSAWFCLEILLYILDRYIGQSDACTTKLANGIRTAL